MRAAVFALIVIAFPAVISAHPAPFSYVDLRIVDSGLEGSLVLHDFDIAHDLGVNPPERLREQAVVESYRDQLTRLMDSRLAIAADGARRAITWTGIEVLPERQSVRLLFRAAGSRPASVRVTAVLFPYDPVHQTFVNVYEGGDLRHQAILDGARPTLDYYAGSWQGARAVIAVFVPAGIEHILIGPDHVLFLIGLLLLGGSLWKLTTIVTAFTIGHSITLSLAALDVVSPPANVVEPVIALSIIFVGADNLLVQREASTRSERSGGRPLGTRSPRDIRAWVAGVFGLVHGFGFASVLKEFGLPVTALGWSLFSFNLGVEIGQLVIVLLVAWTLAAIRRRNESLGRRLVLAGSVIVMAAGGYWFVERVFLTGGA
jgi:hydrogenase/urease accessory protein HupE